MHLPMHETIFCQKTEVFSTNLHVEQNLVHLGRVLHFSQKVVGVILNEIFIQNAQGVFGYFNNSILPSSEDALLRQEKWSQKVSYSRFVYKLGHLKQDFCTKCSRCLWIVTK